MNVLVVEDHGPSAKLIEHFLADSPTCNVVGSVVSLAGAISAIAGQHPDVVLLDLDLVDAGGTEGVMAIREAHPELPIVVLTGSGMEMAGPVMQAGACDYLLKWQISLAQLVQSMTFAVERRKAMLKWLPVRNALEDTDRTIQRMMDLDKGIDPKETMTPDPNRG